MKPNPKCILIVSHSMRPLTKLEMTWSHVGFRYIGAKNPILPEILNSLAETGKAKMFEKDDKFKDQYLSLEVKRGESILLEGEEQ